MVARGQTEGAPTSSTAGPSRLRKAPSQRRSRELVDSLLEATRRLLEQEGPAALTTNRIAEVAGVSIGSLYQYFPDKDALVDALFCAQTERSLEERIDWAQQAFEMPLEPMLRFFFGNFVRQHRYLMSLHAGFYRQQQLRSGARQIGDALVPRMPGQVHVVEAYLREWCARHRDEVRPENIEHAAFLVDRIGYEMMRATFDERPDALEDDAYIEEMIQVLLCYLRAPDAAGEPSGDGRRRSSDAAGPS